MGVVEKEAKLGSTKLHYEEVGIMSRNEPALKTDKAWLWAMDENMSRSESMMTVRA